MTIYKFVEGQLTSQNLTRSVSGTQEVMHDNEMPSVPWVTTSVQLEHSMSTSTEMVPRGRGRVGEEQEEPREEAIMKNWLILPASPRLYKQATGQRHSF